MEKLLADLEKEMMDYIKNSFDTSVKPPKPLSSKTPQDCYDRYLKVDSNYRKINKLLKDSFDMMLNIMNSGNKSDFEKSMTLFLQMMMNIQSKTDIDIKNMVIDATSDIDQKTNKFVNKTDPLLKNPEIICNDCNQKFVCENGSCDNIKDFLLKCLESKGFSLNKNNQQQSTASTTIASNVSVSNASVSNASTLNNSLTTSTSTEQQTNPFMLIIVIVITLVMIFGIYMIRK
jgi:hypothetical protein